MGRKETASGKNGKIIRPGYSFRAACSGRMLKFLLITVFICALLVFSAGAEDGFSYSVSTWEELPETFEKCSTAHENSYTVYYAARMDLSNNQERVSQELFATGVETYSCSFSNEIFRPSMRISKIVYSDPFKICHSEDEVVSYINQCAEEDTADFRIYFGSALSDALFADGHYELQRVLGRSRLLHPEKYSYLEESRRISLSGAAFYPKGLSSGEIVTTVSDFVRVFNDHADRLETEFSIPVTEEVQSRLCQISETGRKDRNDWTLMTDIRENSGIYMSSSAQNGIFYIFSDLKYMTGRKILYALDTDQLFLLNSREKHTLDIAMAMVKQAKGTGAEIEKAVHDALCERITYSSDSEENNDDDCAIGALINGLANCDGYADAFYLCGGLAGLEVRYQFGTMMPQTQEERIQAADDSTHLWNLIRINDQWLMVDVTWDDLDDGKTAYTYFNMDASQARHSHIWDTEALLNPIDAYAKEGARGQDLQQISVNTWDELYGTVKALAVGPKPDRISLSCSPLLNPKANSDRLSTILYSLGIVDFDWSLSAVAAEVFNIEYASHFVIISELDEVEEIICDYAKRDIRSFILYFPVDKYRFLFSDECNGMTRLLAGSMLINPGRFSYISDYGRVTLEDAEFFSSDMHWTRASVKNMSDVRQEIMQFVQAGGRNLLIDYSAGIDLYENYPQLSDALYNAGIRSFDWNFFSPKVV